MGLSAVASDGWQHRVKYAAVSDEQLATYFKIAIDLLHQLTPRIDFEPLPAPIKMTFVRNDHNIWMKAVPELASLQGRWLRGGLATVPGGDGAPVTLQPLAGGSPGWQPRFDSTAIQSSIWPTGELHGDYSLEVQAASRP
jgi:hypothetical protein